MPDNDPNKITAKVGAVEGRVFNGAFAANVGMKVMDGKLGDAAVATGTKILLTKEAYDAAAKLTANIAPVAGALKNAARFIPGLSAGLSLYSTGVEVAANISKGEFKKAAIAGAVGIVETGINAVSGVGGTVVRQALVEGIARTAGEEYRVNDAALVSLGKAAYNKGSKFVAGLGDNNAPQQAAAPDDDKPTSPTRPVKRQPAMGMG